MVLLHDDQCGMGLCNILITSSNFITNSIQFNYKLKIDNKVFKKYSKAFDFKKIKNVNFYNWNYEHNNFLIIIILKILRKIKINMICITILKKLGIFIHYKPPKDKIIHLLNEDQYFLKLARKKTKFAYIDCWDYWKFRDFDSLEKNYNFIKSIFTPIGSYKIEIDNFISNIKYDTKEEDVEIKENCLIGIHIRRGDYKEWLCGKYYYSIDDYIKKMKELLSVFKNEKVKFLICSNEKLESESFKEAGFNFAFGLDDTIKDLYSFAKCDYLIGPPSTYSAWASFYGNVPLFHLENLDNPIEIDLFKTVNEKTLNESNYYKFL